MGLLSRDNVMKMLRRATKGGQHAFAKEHGISQTIVSTSLTGQRGLSPKVLAALGLKKAEAYERQEDAR